MNIAMFFRKLGMYRSAVTSLVALCIFGSGNALAFEQTYTLDPDFNLGLYNGLNHDIPLHDQLQLNTVGTTFPILWVANAGEDTLSRIETDLPSAAIPSGGCETARYRTWFGPTSHGAWSGPAPSRTAVDIDGNVYVANRQFPTSQPMEVMKVLAEGGIDRNGNGVIDTSVDSNGDCQIQAGEIMPMVDSNGNSIVDPDEITDERVAWIVRVGPPNSLGRSLCIGTDGNIWVGDYNNLTYYKIDSGNGGVLAGPISIDVRPYGCLVDGDGTLWSANLGSRLGELNTNIPLAETGHNHTGSNYGIAIGNDKVYPAYPGRSFHEFDPLTNTFSYPASVNIYTRGISVDGNGDIVLGQSSIYKFRPDGSVVWTSTNIGASDTRGVVPDQNNDIWAVNRGSNNITKFRGTDGTFLGSLPVGREPYTYSDATGFAARNVTDPTGFWRVISDSGVAGTDWNNVSWNSEPQGNVPAGATLEVSVRAADAEAGLSLLPYTPTSNGALLAGVVGRFVQVQVLMQPNDANDSPVLSDLRVATLADGGHVCDIDANGVVDRGDIDLIFAGRGTTVPPGDPALDIDGDGLITVNDGRGCVLQCTFPNCELGVN